MKVAIVYDGLYPYRIGGGEKWYRGLAEELVRRGHDVVYLTCRDWIEPPDLPFEVVGVAPSAGTYNAAGSRLIGPALRFGWGVMRYVHAHPTIDVMHCASFPYFSLLGASLGRLGRSRRVVLVSDIFEVWNARYWRDYLGNIRGSIGWAVERAAYRTVSARFVFSKLHRARLGALSSTLLPGLFGGELRDSVGSVKSRPLLLYVGRLIPEKGASLIPEMIELVRRDVDVECQIVGLGPDAEKIQEDINRRGLRASVSILAPLSEEKLRHKLAEASCVLLPSRREGYGLIVIEAAAEGTPVITLRHPDNAAVELISSENGWVVDTADPNDWSTAIRLAVSDSHASKERALVWAHRERVQDSLTWSADVIEREYERLRDRKSSRRRFEIRRRRRG